MTSIDLASDARVIGFAGIHNFRDCGGYAVMGGGRLRSGRLFRSAQHRDATAEDLARVAALDLAAVIDLRSDAERTVAPCPRPDGFSARVLFAPDPVGLAPHVAAAKGGLDPAGAVQRMIDAYAALPFNPTFLIAMRHYFTALAESEGPVLIHCMAGKDRTGIAVAVLHRVLGVAREDWLADYLLTNQAGNIEARIAAGAAPVRALFGRDSDDATVRVLMSVRPEYIDHAFAQIDARYGDLAGYLAACEIDDLLVARVRERLIV